MSNFHGNPLNSQKAAMSSLTSSMAKNKINVPIGHSSNCCKQHVALTVLDVTTPGEPNSGKLHVDQGHALVNQTGSTATSVNT